MGVAQEEYLKAQKEGTKEYRSCVVSGIYPYPQVLDDILQNVEYTTKQDLGLVDIPLDLIKGTKSAGRTTAFSRSFHPLLEVDSEFGNKWIALCKSQMEEGIRDPIKCYEFMGRFYVEEGNKRVSVLRHFKAASIPGTVIRLVPPKKNTPEHQTYYEYMEFYRLSKINFLIMTRPGSYKKLLEKLGMEQEHIWTDEERLAFKAKYYRFRRVYHKGRVEGTTTGDALLTYLSVYPYDDMDSLGDSAIGERLYRLRAELRAARKDVERAVAMQMEPAVIPAEKKGTAKKVLETILPKNRLRVGFLHELDVTTSAWTAAHEFGRAEVDSAMGEMVETRAYFNVERGKNDHDAVEQAVAEGCTIIFTTSPKLIDAALKGAVEHPNVRFLNCSINMPYPSVRTYYGRIFEAKFITGAIAGALADNNKIGYVENYPIYGVMANINAFALGAKMVNPRAQVYLRWSCLPGVEDADEWFLSQGIRVVSNRDMRDPRRPANEFGLYRLTEDGDRQEMAMPFWHWGLYYQQILEKLMNESSKGFQSEQAVNYWWGIGSGVVDVLLSRNLPQEVSRLAYLFKDGVRAALVSPFDMKQIDQNGKVRYPGGAMMSPESILKMDWLAENVVGSIPAKEELIPKAKALVELQGIYDQVTEE